MNADPRGHDQWPMFRTLPMFSLVVMRERKMPLIRRTVRERKQLDSELERLPHLPDSTIERDRVLARRTFDRLLICVAELEYRGIFIDWPGSGFK